MKLYWRIKKNGKWTWRPAHVVSSDNINGKWIVLKKVEERW